MNKPVQALLLATFMGVAQLATAGDPALCLECHVPAEDWEGMSVDDVIAESKNPDFKLHKDQPELSDEALRKMVEELLGN